MDRKKPYLKLKADWKTYVLILDLNEEIPEHDHRDEIDP